MLISHRKQFIFFKTEKTAGTSVEVYFEKYCFPQGNYEYEEPRDEYINEETGIIGPRGGDGRKFNSHMPASEVKKIVPMSIWNSYYKFTIIRNPFDKIVSYFYHLLKIFRDNSFYDLPFRRKVHIITW